MLFAFSREPRLQKPIVTEKMAKLKAPQIFSLFWLCLKRLDLDPNAIRLTAPVNATARKNNTVKNIVESKGVSKILKCNRGK